MANIVCEKLFSKKRKIVTKTFCAKDSKLEHIYNPITALWVFRKCLPFSWATPRGNICQHPISVMGVVDTFGLSPFHQGLSCT